MAVSPVPMARPFVVHTLDREGGGPPPALAGAVVAIGNFDGLHRGHVAVIDRAKALAERLGRPCAVCTFEPHPADYFAGRSVIFRLTPVEAKTRALQRLGVHGLIVLPFDARMAALPAPAFVSDVLVGSLGIQAAVVGYDFHFGQGRLGTPILLREVGAASGLVVEVIGKIVADDQGDLAPVSSTAIRNALELGDVATAARLLGHDWFVVGPVLHGQKIGRTLGFPTANMVLDASCRLRHGIYAVTVADGTTTWGGVASFGRRPTFDDGPPLLETMLFDFEGDLYGRKLEVGFVAWIRGEARFEGIDDLVVAMRGDAATARAALAGRAARSGATL